MRYFIFSAFFIFSLNAQAQYSSLSIHLQDSSLFVAELNSIPYNDASTEMYFHDLNPGNQKLKIIKLMRLGNSEVRKPVFEGVIQLDANRNTKAYIDAMNQFRILDKEPIQSKGSSNGSANNYSWIPDERRIEKNQEPITTSRGMSNDQFKGMIDNLKSINNENDRLQSARGIVSISTISCNQLAEMMLLFDDESKRLNLAEYGSEFVSNPSEINVVFNALRYPSSVRRLNRRLGN